MVAAYTAPDREADGRVPDGPGRSGSPWPTSPTGSVTCSSSRSLGRPERGPAGELGRRRSAGAWRWCRSTPSWPGVRPTAATADPRRDYSTERAVIAEILEVFTRYEISATWAIVGHLLLDQLRGERWPPAPGDRAPGVLLAGRRLVRHRPVLDAGRGAGVLRPRHRRRHRRLSRRPGDRLPFVLPPDRRRPGCGEEAFASDLDACRAAAAADAIDLRSFVFPRNAIDHVDLLGEHGFRCYRGRTADACRSAAWSAPSTGCGRWPGRPSGRSASPAGSGTCPRRTCSRRRPVGGGCPIGIWARRAAGPHPAGGPGTVAVPPLVPPLQRHRRARTGAARARCDLSGGGATA